MNPFKKKAQPAPPPGIVMSTEMKYKQSSVFIKIPNNFTGGNYALIVGQHLAAIEARMPAFFTDLAAAGHRQNIVFQMPTANSCGGNSDGYVKLRDCYTSVGLGGNANRPAFAQELQTVLGNSTHDVNWLAQTVCAVNLPNWTGGVSPNPFAASGPANMVADATAKINSWLAATAHPTDAEMDVLVLALQEWLTPGIGSNTRIYYDPMWSPGGRPPAVGLFHELVHAYYFAKGKNLGREDSSIETQGGRHFELMSVGLPPFQNKKYSENKMRAAWPYPARTQYP